MGEKLVKLQANNDDGHLQGVFTCSVTMLGASAKYLTVLQERRATPGLSPLCLMMR